jgi:DNA-binding beta-propeller fold protein YncE
MKHIPFILLFILLIAMIAPAQSHAQVSNPVVYAALYDENNIGVVDPLTGKLLQRIQVGRNPDMVLLNAKSTRLFVCNSGEISVSIVDISTNRVAQVLRLPIRRRGITAGVMARTPDGGKIFVAEAAETNVPLNVYVIDTEKELVVGQFEAGPHISAMSVSNDGLRLFVVNKGAGIGVFGTPSLQKEGSVAPIEGMADALVSIGCSPVAPKAYATYGVKNVVQVINTSTMKTSGQIAMPKYHTGSQFDVAFSVDGAHAFVINRKTNLKEVDGINLIRTSDDAVIKLFNSGPIERGMCATADNTSFFASALDIKWYNLKSLEHIKSISLRTMIHGIAVIDKQ